MKEYAGPPLWTRVRVRGILHTTMYFLGMHVEQAVDMPHVHKGGG